MLQFFIAAFILFYFTCAAGLNDVIGVINTRAAAELTVSGELTGTAVGLITAVVAVTVAITAP